MPLLGAALFMHSWQLLIVTVIWIVINPVIFPKPKSIDNWMSMGVVGEEIYFAEGKKIKKDLPTLLNVLNIPAFVAFIYFCWQQQIEPAILSGIIVMVIKFWFIDRMAQLAKKEKN